MVKHDKPEARLSHYVDALLDRILTEPCWYTAVDTGTVMVNSRPEARMMWEQRRRAMGIKPHALDWMVYQSGVFACFELKIAGGRVSDGQKTTIALLSERDIPAAVCWSIWDVYEFLVRSKFLLHANAENIAVEISARWQAAQEGADEKKGKPKKAARSRAAKPTLQQVRKLTAMRGRIQF